MDCSKKMINISDITTNFLEKIRDETNRIDPRYTASILQEVKIEIEEYVIRNVVNNIDDALIQLSIDLQNDETSAQIELENFLSELITIFEDLVEDDDCAFDIYRFLHDAHEQVEYSPCCFIVKSLQSMDFEQTLVKMLEPMDSILELPSIDKDRRARFTMRGIEETAESTHKHALQFIWNLRCYLKGKNCWKKQSYGQLVKDINSNLPEYPNIVEQHIVNLRNASAHKSWVYIPDTDSVQIFDKDEKSEVYTVDELISTLEIVYRQSTHSIYNAAALYILELAKSANISDCTIQFFKVIQDEDKIESIKQDLIENKLETALIPFAQHSQKYYSEYL